ncbi:MAG: zeta toxin family protein [Myxococcales bacterium]|nr:zeta toxin family protein [Myxococcales bacterium]
MANDEPPILWVLAGASGAGKSSIGGAMIRRRGADYFDPDETAAMLRATGTLAAQADAEAWNIGRALLERAIEQRLDFAIETTLGGRTMPALLREAATRGFVVNVWFVGLASAELHIARVRARAGRGGHDVDDATIRRRWDTCRENLIDLLPFLAEVRIFDNSAHGDPHAGQPPAPRELAYLVRGRIARRCAEVATPAWVKPILAAAMNLAP